MGNVVYQPDAPLAAIRQRAAGAEVAFLDGGQVQATAAVAKSTDIAIVFAEQWTSEGTDWDYRLSAHQEALIKAVVAANPRTIVVLETGGAIQMPWANQVNGILEACESKKSGQEAIVTAGVVVGMRTSHNIAPASSATAHLNFVPLASIAATSPLLILRSRRAGEDEALDGAIRRKVQAILDLVEPDLQMDEFKPPVPAQADRMIGPRLQMKRPMNAGWAFLNRMSLIRS